MFLRQKDWGEKGVFTSKRLPFLPPQTPKLPGDLAEIDSVRIRIGQGTMRYQITVVDVVSRMVVVLSMRRAYQRCCGQSD